MRVYTFNPYFWDSTSVQVSSRVVAYSISSNDGSTLDIKNSPKQIIMSIPHPTSSLLQRSNFILSEGKNGMAINYHRIQLTNQSSLHIELLPTNYCVSFFVYIKYSSKPTTTDYDFKRFVPDLSHCNVSEQRVRGDICLFYRRFVSSLSNCGIDCNKREKLEREIKERISSTCTEDPFVIFIPENHTRKGSYYLGT